MRLRILTFVIQIGTYEYYEFVQSTNGPNLIYMSATELICLGRQQVLNL